MQIDQYIELQSNWIKEEYLADYDIHDYPAISFASWEVATSQLEIMNRGKSKRTEWLGATSAGDKSRVLYYPESDFRQLWVRHDLNGYRIAGINFLRDEFSVSESVAASWHADHLVPRSKFKDKHPDGVTVLYFIPSRANTSWGGGYERLTKDDAMKIRGGITLVSVAKSMGILGPSKPKNRTYGDVAKELMQRDIASKEYGDDNFYGTYAELTKIETELRCAAGDRTAQPLKGQPTQIVRPELRIHGGAINALRRDVPQLMETVLMDNMVARREAAIDTWIASRQELDSLGHPQGLLLKSVFELLLSNEQLFPLDRITQKVDDVLSPRGAVAYLLDQTAVTGGWSTFARLGVSQVVDYNWQG